MPKGNKAPRGRGNGSRGRGADRGGRGTNPYGNPSGNKGGVRVISATSEASRGKEKTVRVEIENKDGEGHFGQAIGYALLHDAATRKLLHAIVAERHPQILKDGDADMTSKAGTESTAVTAALIAALTSGASGSSSNNLLSSLLQNSLSGKQDGGETSNVKDKDENSTNKSDSAATTDSKGLPLTKMSAKSIATLWLNGKIANEDLAAWCTFSKVQVAHVYNAAERHQLTGSAAPGSAYKTPDRSTLKPRVSWSQASGTPGSADSSTSAASAYSVKGSLAMDDLLGFDASTVDAGEKKTREEAFKIAAVIERCFMHTTGGGFKLSILDKYLRKNFAEMNIEDANLERTAGYLKLQSRDPKFINIVQKCALHIITKQGDQLWSTKKKASSKPRSNGKRKQRTTGDDEDGQTLDLSNLSPGDTPAAGGGGSASASDSLQGIGSVGIDESVVYSTPFCGCVSLYHFPTDLKLYYDACVLVPIPSNTRVHHASSCDSKGARRFMCLLTNILELGNITLEQIVWYTDTCIRGSMHVLTDTTTPAHSRTYRNCDSSVTLAPYHLYRWHYVLCDIVQNRTVTHGPTDPCVMCISMLKTRVSLCIIRHRAKKSHARTCDVIDTLIKHMHTFHGCIVNKLPRRTSMNALYIKYSVYNGYCYIGETTTSERFYDHNRHSIRGAINQQRVHIVISRNGHHLYDTLVVNFPSSFTRFTFETVLIHKFSCMGKYLLNVRQRCNSMPDSKSLQVKRALRDYHASHTHRLNKRSRHTAISTFIRPYAPIVTRIHAIQPTKIPTAILFGGGIGGVTDGLLRTGKYEICVVFEYDTLACTSHRRRYPHIPVCQYTLGGDIHEFIHTFRKYIPFKDWHSCLIQASPPCRDLSTSNKKHIIRDDAMRLVEWTLSVVDIICPIVYLIENVSRMHEYLTDIHAHRHSSVYDLSYYVPQRRLRAIVTNFPLEAYIVPLSDVPLAAMTVLPCTHKHTRIVNRYGYSSSLNKPSLTIVGHTMYMFDTRTNVRQPMPIDVAKVLQGFAHSLDIDNIIPGLKQQRLAIGDAVPPPFIYACGLACFAYAHRHAYVPTSLIPASAPSLSDVWPRYYTIVNDASTPPSSNLSPIILLCTSDIWTLIECTHGTTDINNYSLRGDDRLVGECMMFIDGIIDRSTLLKGMRAISTGRCKFILVRAARRADTIPPSMMLIFRTICKLAPQWPKLERRKRIFALLGTYTYSELHHLYIISKHILDSKVRARVRCTITRYSMFRFKVHPAPSFSVTIPAVFGVRRSILTRIVWCILRKCHIPLATKRDIHNAVTYSFTANPSVKAILCNSRSRCKQWDANEVWACTCDTIRSRLGITHDTTHTVCLHDGSRHIHTFMSQCDGGFKDVFSMNLNDICEPDRDHLVDSIPKALLTCLSVIKRFVCNLRNRDLYDFRFIHTGGNNTITIDSNDTLSESITHALASLGLPIDSDCARHIRSLSASIRSFPENLLCKASRVYACAEYLRGDAITFYCDKNGGVGTVCCPRVAWYAMYDKLWNNPEYKHTTLTPDALRTELLHTYTTNKWSDFARFRKDGDSANDPFINVKFKNLLKYRPILSAYKHCLKHVHQRVCTALNVCLRIIATDSPLYANTLSTFAASKSTINQWNHTTSLCTDVSDMVVTGYAGDISSMFDKLDGNVVLTAIEWTLAHTLLACKRRYNLRSDIRRYITLHLTDPNRHGIGTKYSGESCVTISFEHAMQVCNHYIFHTHFYMSGVLILLLLGIPQGGPLSGPLSHIFTVYCEYLFHCSLYDYTRVSHAGIIRLNDLTDLGIRTLFPDGSSVTQLGESIVMHVMFKRYADDCRAVILHTPNMNDAVAKYLHAYKHTCYSKPCELEDEGDQPSFDFLQGMFVFTPTACIARYESKNFTHFASTGRPRFRSMQHYHSYCTSPSNMRYSTVAGKLSEIDSFSSSDVCRAAGVLSLIPDLVHLMYPPSLLSKALYVRTQHTANPVWAIMAPFAHRYMQLQYKCYYGQ